MDEKNSQQKRVRLRALGLAGAVAFVGLGALSLTDGHGNSGRVDLAGSGDAPASTVYVQPTEKAMNMGATATWTTPSATAATTKAVPPLGVAEMRGLRAGAVLGLSCLAMAMAGTVVAQAASAPNVVGQKYSDATSAISGAGFKVVVSTTVGDQKAWPDCLVSNQVSRTQAPPENSSGAPIQQVLVSLDCDDGEASATTPGYSAGSPEGKSAAAAAAAAKKAAATSAS